MINIEEYKNSYYNEFLTREELWKKYYASDHGVFARYLAKNITKKEIKALQESYENARKETRRNLQSFF